MPSPFPGMDPYLECESRWPTFHGHLVSSLKEILVPGLTDRYHAVILERRYHAGSAAAKEGFIEIRQSSDGRLITLMDVVSPANKATSAGREAYLEKRREGKNCNSNVVEIDLIVQGQPTLDYSREGLPEWDYAVTVTRSTQPVRYEIYTATLEKRLPRFRVPLAADDRDTVVDLQAAFARAYEQGGFARDVDYCREPGMPLSEEEHRWLAETLKWPNLAHEEIAAVARRIWEEQGRPHGRAEEHWRTAEERLRRERMMKQ
jgi:hypothetical protein